MADGWPEDPVGWSGNRRAMLGWAAGAVGLAVGAAIGSAVPAAAAPPDGALPAAPDPTAPLPPLPVTAPAQHVRDLVASAPANAIALTVDDGPHPIWTPQILALLRRLDIRATFSLIGSQAHGRPDLVRRIVGDGHVLTNHTMTHPQPFAARSATAVRREIVNAQSAIAEAAGVAPRLFRSPGGSWSAGVLAATAAAGLRPVSWDVDPRDWTRPGTAAITSRLLSARAGDIVLCHDGGGNRAETLAALAAVLPRLRDRGLRFVTL
jgi:peptidoglycan/xylan/chitin deacetylase (PgdA/CDA1 family)